MKVEVNPSFIRELSGYSEVIEWMNQKWSR